MLWQHVFQVVVRELSVSLARLSVSSLRIVQMDRNM